MNLNPGRPALTWTIAGMIAAVALALIFLSYLNPDSLTSFANLRWC